MRKRKRTIFTFHFMLALLLMISLNIVDTFMLRQKALNWEAERVNVPNADVEVHPYHFWVNTVFYMTAQFTIALSYWFVTKDTKGMLILLTVAVIFIAFAVQDVWFFIYQGEQLPNEWTWLYWQNRVFGTPLSARFVLNMAMLGSILIVALFFLHFKKLR